MIGLIGLNLVRNRGRSALTATGIGIGVATIVALLALTQGLKQSFGGLSHLGGADLGLFQSNVADPTASVLPASMRERVARVPGVQDDAAIQLVTDAMPRAPSALVFGVDFGSFVARRLVITAGQVPGPGQAIVGDALARRLKVAPGSTLMLKGQPFGVSGTFHSGVSFEDQGAVVGSADATRLAGGRSGVTTIAITLKPHSDAASVSAALQNAFPGTTTISNPGEAARANPGFEIVTKAVLVIAVLALVLGAIAVTNTMAMAVLERQREFALLAAIGWSGRQVATLILGEGAGVGLLGAALGLGLGVVASQLIVSLLSASGFVSPVLTLWGIGRGLLIGIAIGVLGGIYPAWRVTRLPPARLLGRF